MEARGARVTGARAEGITTDYTDYTDEDLTPDPDCGIPLIMSRNPQIKVSDEQMAALDLLKHPILPEWNYTLLPRINRN
jgi:hypothetical protein